MSLNRSAGSTRLYSVLLVNPSSSKGGNSLSWRVAVEGTALGEEFTGVSQFIPITYQDDWEIIRTIQEANGVEYTPEGLEAE